MRDATEMAVVRHMVEVHAALTRARDVDELMAAVVDVLASTGPRAIDFSQVHTGADGAPREIEVIRVWQDGSIAAEHPMYGRRFPFAGSPFGEAVLSEPRRAFYIEDLAAEPRASAEIADLPRDIGAVAVLPLYSERHAAWQGVIVIQWRRPHELGEVERQLHALVICAAAEALASERSRGHNEALLRLQAEALAERSTPLIPVRDDLLVLPLIGTIDAERGRQVLEALTHLGGRTHVRAAILDLTGVRALDAAAASMLLAAARAARLRGVHPVVTGIQPAAAAALVGEGADFTGIEVCPTLQDAIERHVYRPALPARSRP